MFEEETLGVDTPPIWNRPGTSKKNEAAGPTPPFKTVPSPAFTIFGYPGWLVIGGAVAGLWLINSK